MLCCQAAGDKPPGPGATPKPAAAPPASDLASKIAAQSDDPKPDLRTASSKRAISKVAPLDQTLASAPTGEGGDTDAVATEGDDTDAVATDGDDGEELQAAPKERTWLFMLGAIAARLLLTMAMLFFQKRRQASGDAGGSGLAEALMSSPLGGVVRALQHGWEQLATLARSPMAGPVVMGLLIFAMKLVQRMDEANTAVEEVDATVVAGESEDEPAELAQVDGEDGTDADSGAATLAQDVNAGSGTSDPDAVEGADANDGVGEGDDDDLSGGGEEGGDGKES